MDILLEQQRTRMMQHIRILQELGHLAYTATQVTDDKNRIKWQEASARQYADAHQLYMDVTQS